MCACAGERSVHACVCTPSKCTRVCTDQQDNQVDVCAHLCTGPDSGYARRLCVCVCVPVGYEAALALWRAHSLRFSKTLLRNTSDPMLAHAGRR